MKRTICLLLTMLLCCMWMAAGAESMTLTLPEGSVVEGVYPQSDGALIVCTANAVLRMEMDGTETQLAEDQEHSISAVASPEGDVYGADLDEVREGVIRFYHLQMEKGTWEKLTEMEVNANFQGVGRGIYLNGQYFWLVAKEGFNRLVSYDPVTGEATDCGDFGMLYASDDLFPMEDRVALCSYDADRQQNMLYDYDMQTGVIGEKKLSDQQLMLRCVTCRDGQFWAIGTNRDNWESALYQGESLEKLEKVATSAEAAFLVPVEDGCLLVNGSSLYSSDMLTNASCTLVLNGYEGEHDTAFTMETGITLTSTFQDMATVLNTRSSDVDIFLLGRGEDFSLKLLKDKGMYADLSESKALMEQAERLWPSIASHVMTESGKLMAWPVGIDPISFDPWLDQVEEEFGIHLDAPSTLPELLDQIQQLEAAGVFDTGSFVPLDISYDQKTLITYVMNRYAEEQIVLGKQLFFDSDELRSLLNQIMTQVPKENPYTTGHNTVQVYHLYVGYSAISDDMGMPLRISDASPLSLPTYARFLVVNPYSEHQAEAIRYLNYLASRSSDLDYYLFADMTEPKEDPYYEEEMADITAQLAELEQLDPTAEVKEQLELLNESKAWREENRYIISEADIAAWQNMANAMAIMEEGSPAESEQIIKLRNRLIDGGLTVDEFLKACDDYLRMVYAEDQ